MIDLISLDNKNKLTLWRVPRVLRKLLKSSEPSQDRHYFGTLTLSTMGDFPDPQFIARGR